MKVKSEVVKMIFKLHLLASLKQVNLQITNEYIYCYSLATECILVLLDVQVSSRICNLDLL